MEIIKDYPAVTYFKPEPVHIYASGSPDRKIVHLFNNDVFAVFDGVHRGHAIFTNYTLGSVVSYALKSGEDPIDAYERAKENGQRLHWANQNAVTISNMKTEKRLVPVLKIGEEVWFEGKLFQITTAPNRNIELTEVA